MASKHSVSTLINISQHLKKFSSSFQGPAKSLSRGLQTCLDSYSKAAAASRSKIPPLLRPGSLHLFKQGQFPPGLMEKKNIFLEAEMRKKSSNLIGMGMEVIYKDPLLLI